MYTNLVDGSAIHHQTPAAGSFAGQQSGVAVVRQAFSVREKRSNQLPDRNS
jgi:hypothetical protein